MTDRNWRADQLRLAVLGVTPIDDALHLVGARTGDLATKARQDLGDAIAAHQAGDRATAMATAVDLAAEIQAKRAPKAGAAA